MYCVKCILCSIVLRLSETYTKKKYSIVVYASNDIKDIVTLWFYLP